jgi:hypothetical protein
VPHFKKLPEGQLPGRCNTSLGPIPSLSVPTLICQGTVEERIHQLQAKKSQLADSLLSDAARAAAPDESTLSALLAPLG